MASRQSGSCTTLEPSGRSTTPGLLADRAFGEGRWSVTPICQALSPCFEIEGEPGLATVHCTTSFRLSKYQRQGGSLAKWMCWRSEPSFVPGVRSAIASQPELPRRSVDSTKRSDRPGDRRCVDVTSIGSTPPDRRIERARPAQGNRSLSRTSVGDAYLVLGVFGRATYAPCSLKGRTPFFANIGAESAEWWASERHARCPTDRRRTSTG